MTPADRLALVHDEDRQHRESSWNTLVASAATTPTSSASGEATTEPSGGSAPMSRSTSTARVGPFWREAPSRTSPSSSEPSSRPRERILLGGTRYLGGIALLAFAVGAIIRVADGALATVLGPLLVIEVLFRTLPVDFFRQIGPFLPATAGHQMLATQASIEQARVTSSAPVLDPWAGFTVMLVWVAVAVALAVAAVQVRRRDA